jgi:UDP-glucuronate decarboxylase
MQQKKILVTGGAGFVGSHLCKRLLQDGNVVICLDNFSTGKKERIEPFLALPSFHFIEQDICLPIDIEVDEIYNLACPASPIHYQADPIQTLKTCVLGALHVLELARKYSCKVFQASTSEVYGDPLSHPQIESDWGNVNPIGIRSCYDEGKRCAETLFFDYWRKNGVEIKVGRIFNTYGPGMDPNDGRIIANFIIQALTKSPLTIFGQGNQTRSFCYIEDLIEAIIRFMNTPSTITGPLNLGNPTELRVLDLAAKILSLTNSNSPLIFQPLPLDDPRQRRPDISRAKELLQWEPKITLHEGLIETISFFQQLLDL